MRDGHLLRVRILFFFSILISCHGNCTGPKDRHCRNGPLIRMPFYMKMDEEPSCGYPGFNVSCNTAYQPVLNILDNFFVIRDIDFQKSSIRVVRDVFSNLRDASCVPRISNTVSFGDQFHVVGNQPQLLLLYNCNSTATNNASIPFTSCSGNGSGEINIAVLKEKASASMMEGCESVVTVPVDTIEEDGRKVGVVELIDRGFWLNWSYHFNCSLCMDNGGHCGSDYQTNITGCFCEDKSDSAHCHPFAVKNNDNRALKVGLGVGGAFLTIIVAAGIILFCYRRRRRANLLRISTSSSIEHSTKEDVEFGSDYAGVPVFTYAELEAATRGFSEENELGEGGFGTVYYGKLNDGREVAVKRMYEHSYRRVAQFMNEITILTNIRHKYLVSLYGCTSRRSRDLLLVYEFVSNGTVFDHLHGKRMKNSQLTWGIRMKVAIETASALVYLHASDIIHRDVKTHNILLDENFSVKVADFGLSRLFPMDKTHVSTAPQGTPGYVDPDYHQTYQLTDKSDVYSFGVVLIELVSSLPAVDITRDWSEINLGYLALKRVQSSAYDELIDHKLGYGTNEEVTTMSVAVSDLAFRCVQVDKLMRPSMVEVLEELVRIQNNGGQAESLPWNSGESPLLKNGMNPSSPTSVIGKWTSSRTSAASISIGSTFKD